MCHPSPSSSLVSSPPPSHDPRTEKRDCCARTVSSSVVGPARIRCLSLVHLQMDAIPADFFSDLVPIKPNGSREPAAPKSGALQTDAVLPSRPDASSPSAALDAAGRSGLAGMQPMGDSRLRREVKEFEGATQAVVESILQRFADGLKGVLDVTNRSSSHL